MSVFFMVWIEHKKTFFTDAKRQKRGILGCVHLIKNASAVPKMTLSVKFTDEAPCVYTGGFFYAMIREILWNIAFCGDNMADATKLISDEEMLAAVREAIFRLVSGHQSYTGPNGETYTKANLSDLEKLEQYYEKKVVAKNAKNGGLSTFQVRF